MLSGYGQQGMKQVVDDGFVTCTFQRMKAKEWLKMAKRIGWPVIAETLKVDTDDL